MKKSEFITTVCKAIAKNEIKGFSVRALMMDLASSGACRPCWEICRAYSDHTQEVIRILERHGIHQQGRSIEGVNIRAGWVLKNDAARGGKCGNIIFVNFERR